jgi:hypothetical protein
MTEITIEYKLVKHSGVVLWSVLVDGGHDPDRGAWNGAEKSKRKAVKAAEAQKRIAEDIAAGKRRRHR